MAITGKQLKEAFLMGAASLTKNKDYINELNVFPVPDGDTGTNMAMTLEMAVNALGAVEDESIENVCKAIQQGSLRGARGNSGVIMSQILRGFTNYIREEKNVDFKKICLGIEKAREQAYKAVIKPKEGTILTVIKALAKKAIDISKQNISIEKLEEIVKAGDEALANTPNLLPILKEAGVVDSGGQGLMCFMHGVMAYIKGDKIDFDIKNTSGAVNTNINISVEEDQDIKYGYCTECMINNSKGFKKTAEEELKSYLGDPSFGDSLVLVADETLIKIHVHTNHPGKVFEKGLEYGYLTNLKVDNLKLEHQEKLIKDASKKAKEQGGVSVEKKKTKPMKEYGFISVSSGDGLTSILKDLNVDLVIEGGQTMNPSTDDFMKAIDEVNAKNIFVFPNNKNIIMAAKQAKDLCEDKKIYVVETKNVLQGINCMIYYTEKKDKEEIYEAFNDTIKNMKTIEVTYAVRNTTIEGIDIKENNYLALSDKGLLATHENMDDCIFDAYEKIKSDEDEVISIYYGKDIKEDEANDFADKMREKYEDKDIEVYNGGQSVYYYYISIE